MWYEYANEEARKRAHALLPTRVVNYDLGYPIVVCKENGDFEVPDANLFDEETFLEGQRSLWAHYEEELAFRKRFLLLHYLFLLSLFPLTFLPVLVAVESSYLPPLTTTMMVIRDNLLWSLCDCDLIFSFFSFPFEAGKRSKDALFASWMEILLQDLLLHRVDSAAG